MSITAGKIAKFANSSGTVEDSVITESGGSIGVGTATPGQPLDVNGTVRARSVLQFNDGTTTHGLLCKSGLWQGDASADMAFAAETGKALKFYTNGSATPRLAVLTDGATVCRGPGPWIDVRAFGADNTGATNTRDNIQAALDAVPTTGATVFFPPGVYRIDSPLTLPNYPCRILGAGQEVSVIVRSILVSTGNAFEKTYAFGDYYVAFPVVFESLTIATNGNNSNGSAIYLSTDVMATSVNEEVFIVRDVCIRPEESTAASLGFKYGIQVAGGWNGVIDNVTIHGANNNRTIMDRAIYLRGKSLDVNISNFRISYCVYGIYVGDLCEGTLISKGWIVDCNQGIWCETRPAAQFAISSLTAASPAVLTTPSAHGWSNGDIVFIANRSGSTPAVDGTWVVKNATSTTFQMADPATQAVLNVSVSGSGGTVSHSNHPWLTVTDVHISCAATAIYLKDHPQCSISDCLIYKEQVSSSGFNAIYITGGGHTTITANKVFDLAGPAHGGSNGIAIIGATDLRGVWKHR